MTSNRILLAIAAAALVAAVLVDIVRGHPGGLDAAGGHVDKSTGTYHYHRAPSSQPAPEPAPALSVRVPSATELVAFSACRSEPATPAAEWCQIWFDFDGDRDIDADDFGRLQRGWIPGLAYLGRWARWANDRGRELALLRAEVAGLRQKLSELQSDLDQVVRYDGVQQDRIEAKLDELLVKASIIWTSQPAP